MEDLKPKALFLFGCDDNPLPDYLVCKSCELGCAVNGRIPDPQPLLPGDSIDKGKSGDLAPPCIKSQLANLGHWQGHQGAQFPEELLPLRLFKCRMGYWLVVPGLLD